MGDVKSNNHMVRNIILVVSLFLAIAVLARIVKSTPADKKISPQTKESSDSFCNGYFWVKIDNLNLSDSMKVKIKGDFVKLNIETRALCGNPISNPNVPLAEYVGYIDKFYTANENMAIPIHFALRMADMAANGSDEATLEAYRGAVAQKLKSSNLIE